MTAFIFLILTIIAFIVMTVFAIKDVKSPSRTNKTVTYVSAILMAAFGLVTIHFNHQNDKDELIIHTEDIEKYDGDAVSQPDDSVNTYEKWTF